MLTVNGTKMSKSLDNSFLPKELFSGAHPLLEKAYSPMSVRFFMLQSHYRSTLDFSNGALQAAERGFTRLLNSYKTLSKLEHKAGTVDAQEVLDVKQLCEAIYANINDDFNTAESIAVLFDMSKKINAYKEGVLSIGTLDTETYALLKTTFTVFFRDILGLDKEEEQDNNVTEGLMNLILELRKQVRANKDFASSDKIRDALNELNIKVKDGKDETTWSIEQ
jgi:cysteinyl-tRNA synthetase